MKRPGWFARDDKGNAYVNPRTFKYDWHAAVYWLMDSGMPEKKAREVVGQVAKYIPSEHLRTAFWVQVVKAEPADPIPYLYEMLKPYSDAPGTDFKKPKEAAPPLKIVSYAEAWRLKPKVEFSVAQRNRGLAHLNRMWAKMERVKEAKS